MASIFRDNEHFEKEYDELASEVIAPNDPRVKDIMSQLFNKIQQGGLKILDLNELRYLEAAYHHCLGNWACGVSSDIICSLNNKLEPSEVKVVDQIYDDFFYTASKLFTLAIYDYGVGDLSLEDCLKACRQYVKMSIGHYKQMKEFLLEHNCSEADLDDALTNHDNTPDD